MRLAVHHLAGFSEAAEHASVAGQRSCVRGALHQNAPRPGQDCPPAGQVRGARITRFGRRFRLGAAAGVPLRDVQIAARRAGPGTTTICGRGSENSGRPAAPGVVVASAAGG